MNKSAKSGRRSQQSLKVESKDVFIAGKLVRIARIDGEGYQFLEDPEAALKVLRESGNRIDLFTFIQKITETTPKYNYPMEWDNMAVIPVTNFDDWMKNQIDSKSRNMVRKAAKNGVVVKEVPFDDDLIRGISEIYNESPLRQGRKFLHYGRDLESLRKIKATFLERSIFIGAFFEDRLIGFIKMVTDENRSQAGLMHILSMIKHRDKAPTNALVAQAVKSCGERSIPNLWYANMAYGKKSDSALADFKKNNGFQKVDLPRYYVPLTLAGRMALHLDLQHGIYEKIPEPVAATYRKIRGMWYAKKFPIEKQNVRPKIASKIQTE
jgi:hypothetical protein